MTEVEDVVDTEELYDRRHPHMDVELEEGGEREVEKGRDPTLRSQTGGEDPCVKRRENTPTDGSDVEVEVGKRM